MTSLSTPYRGECPECGETVPTSAAGQVHPHSGRNGCGFSGWSV